MINCTVSGNSYDLNNEGNGIAIGGGTTTLGNTIVVGNSGDDVSTDNSGETVNSLGNNLIGETFTSGWIASDKLNTSANLQALGYYGGLTQTMLPNANSPAIGAGNTALVPNGITTDQRGGPRIVSGTVDIGAVEYQYPSFTVTTNPADAAVVVGQTATFTAATNALPSFATVQWQELVGVWTNLSNGGAFAGVTTTTLSVTPNAKMGFNGKEYRAVFTSPGYVPTYQVTSNFATLTVNKATPSISTTQEQTTAVVGTPIADQATVSGGGSAPSGTVTFDLYNNPDGTGTALSLGRNRPPAYL